MKNENGVWLQSRRMSLKIERKELAEQIGYSAEYVKSVELGKKSGSSELWGKVYDYLGGKDSQPLDHQSTELISKMKKDLKKSGGDTKVRLYYRQKDGKTMMSDYCLDHQLDEQEKSKDFVNGVVDTHLKHAIQLMRSQTQ